MTPATQGVRAQLADVYDAMAAFLRDGSPEHEAAAREAVDGFDFEAVILGPLPDELFGEQAGPWRVVMGDAINRMRAALVDDGPDLDEMAQAMRDALADVDDLDYPDDLPPLDAAGDLFDLDDAIAALNEHDPHREAIERVADDGEHLAARIILAGMVERADGMAIDVCDVLGLPALDLYELHTAETADDVIELARALAETVDE